MLDSWSGSIHFWKNSTITVTQMTNLIKNHNLTYQSLLWSNAKVEVIYETKFDLRNWSTSSRSGNNNNNNGQQEKNEDDNEIEDDDNKAEDDE